MKTKILGAFIALTLVLGFSSCENYFGDINVDPNNPTSVTPSVLLPPTQGAIAYVLGGDLSRYVGIYSQHIDGVTRQFSVIQNYGISNADVNPTWENVYIFALKELSELRKQTEANGYNHFTGIAKVQEAYAILMLTDYFGDMPYSQALQGTDLLQPQYDSQESIYTAVFQLLEEAKTLLAGAGGNITPGSEDLIYGGDADLWWKAAHVIAARAYLHLSNVSATNFQNALDELAAGGFTSGADDMTFGFTSAPSESSPWFQYNEQRQDIAIGDSYVALLQSLNDPREAWYGVTLDESHPYFTRSRAVNLITFTEQKFIEAEARMKTEGATAATHQAYLDAIAASFDHLGISADYAAYVGQAAVDPGQANLTMNEIMTQKYIALFTDPEVFSDWRRTGIPSLTPNTGSVVPRRLPYPMNEIDFNPNTPGVTIFDKVWWDQ